MNEAPRGLAASVQTRLVRHAKQIGMDPNFVLARFAAERFLFRVSRSPHADRFVLKGALMMLVWLGETIRPTRDADLLGFGEITEQTVKAIFTEVCRLEVEADDLEFLSDSLRVAPIRIEDAYGGLRATLQARLGNARLHVQVDIGIGDAVTPEPEWMEYPALLDFPRPRHRERGAYDIIAGRHRKAPEGTGRHRTSLDVLHLLAHLLDQHFHVYGGTRGLDVL